MKASVDARYSTALTFPLIDGRAVTSSVGGLHNRSI